MKFHVLTALTGGTFFLFGPVSAAPKHHQISHTQPVLPELEIIDGKDTPDEEKQIVFINKSVINHSKLKFSSVTLAVSFFDEKGKMLKVSRLSTPDLAPAATWKIAIPVSFLGKPTINEYCILSLSGVRNGKSITSYTGDAKYPVPLPYVLPDLSTFSAGSHSLHYIGPTVDSLFINPDLQLLQADFVPASIAVTPSHDLDPNAITKLTGIIQNVSDKTYDYVEVKANAYDYDGGTQIDSSLANTTSLAPGEKWQFTISFLNGKEARVWRMTKITGNSVAH